jgi:hypothetical protein
MKTPWDTNGQRVKSREKAAFWLESIRPVSMVNHC